MVGVSEEPDAAPRGEAGDGVGWRRAGDLGRQRRLDRLRTLAVGVATGVVAGMGGFMYTREAFVPTVGPLAGAWYPSVLAALAGAFVYLLTPDARESIQAAIVGFLAGIATIVVAWMGPLWLLDYAPLARDVYIRQRLQLTVPGVVTTLVLVYWGGYLTTMLVAGYLDV